MRMGYGDKPGSPLAGNREVAVTQRVSVTRIYIAWVRQWEVAWDLTCMG